MSNEMLINTIDERECRIAIVKDGNLEELYTERVSHASRVGNVYKGRITNVEPSIQAAFVDFGASKNGFLHISDVHPQYFAKGAKGNDAVGRKRGLRDRPPIQECLRRGQEIVVQMTKEGIGTKGPTMTTYLSIPGRLLVMMPGMSKLGVSRKIESEETREKIKQMLGDIALPNDVGVIVRTAGVDRSKRDLQRDLNYLLRLWKTVSQKIATTRAPAEIYQESDLVTRTIRDVYNSDITRIVCDSEEVAAQVHDFLDVAMPRGKQSLEVYVGKQGLFHDYGLEGEIEKIYSRRVELKSGGSLVIDQAEALVAIDVNSGRFRDHSDAETTALNINMEAAKEIARQLRLRDLGGVIIIDFVDMREEANRRAVEKVLREAVKPDRAKTKVLKISAFGIVEMTRQRVRPSLKDSIHVTCKHCSGTGVVKSPESAALAVMRDIVRASSHDDVASITVSISPDVANHLLNEQRAQLHKLEKAYGKTITIVGDHDLLGNEFRIVCQNNRHTDVAWDKDVQRSDRSKTLLTVPAEKVLSGRPHRSAEEEDAEAAIEEMEPTVTTAAEDQASPEPQPDQAAPDAEAPRKQPRKRRRRRSKSKQAQAQQAQGPNAAPAPAPEPEPQPEPQASEPAEAQPAQTAAADAQAPAGEKPKRRTRRGGRRHRKKTGTQQQQAQGADQQTLFDESAEPPSPEPVVVKPRILLPNPLRKAVNPVDDVTDDDDWGEE